MKLRIGALAAASAFLLAGCGGGGGAGSSAGGAASVVPDNVGAFLKVDTRMNSTAWKQAQVLLRRFPGERAVLASFHAQLRSHGLSWEQDVKPALGDEVDVVWLGGPARRGDVVSLIKPADKGKFDALLEKGSNPAVHEEVDGWTVFADSKAQLDAFDRAREDNGSLADSSDFKDAMEGLPQNAIARSYVNARVVQDAFDQRSHVPGIILGDSPVGSVRGFGAAVTPAEDGVRVYAAAKGVTGGSQSYHAELPNVFPSGPFLFVSAPHVGSTLEDGLRSASRSTPALDQARAQLELALGMSFDDVAKLLGGEGAFALYPTQSGSPAALFAIRVTDDEKARRLLDRLGALAGLIGGQQVHVTHVNVGGVQVSKFVLGPGSTVYGSVANGTLAITNSRQQLVAMAGGAKLSSDPAYQQAAAGAGLPDKTTGFLYVNSRAALEYAFGYAGSHGSSVPPIARDNTAPLRGLLLYSTRSGDRVVVTGFLGIR